MRGFRLSDSVEVVFDPRDKNINAISELVSGSDFYEDAQMMLRSLGSVRRTLISYDDLSVIGTGKKGGGIIIGIRQYSHDSIVSAIDMALASEKRIRILDRTRDRVMQERVESRTCLDWIGYNHNSKVLEELAGIPCPAKKDLQSLPAKKELYSLSSWKAGTMVAHLRIDDSYMAIDGNGQIIKRIVCKSAGNSLFKAPIDAVEDMLKSGKPDALVIREPLKHCSDCGAGYSCLSQVYGEMYCSKIGMEEMQDKYPGLWQAPMLN